MNIFRYIDKYGCYSFDEVSFNDIDNLIFSSIVYVDLNNYVSKNRFNKKKIKDVGSEFFTNYNKKDKNITAIKNGIKVLRYIKNTRRYKDLLLYNYIYIGDFKQQFSAITIEINRHLVYVAFEGTDQLISGWKEDFMMAYKFPVLAQRRAIDYINKYFLFNNKDIIIGGHSKGGNLAMVAGMYANYWIRDRIIKIYNNDGPGFKEEQFESKYYKNIINKLVYIIPNYSIVGLLLEHSDNYIVVKSLKKGIYAHNLANWVVLDNQLYVTQLSSYSKIFDESMKLWLDKYDDNDKMIFVNELFLIFEKVGVVSLLDIIKNKKIILNIIKETSGLNDKIKNMIKDFMYILFDLFKDSTVDEIDHFFHNKK